MAAALIVSTHERADALGVPADRRVYLRGWCEARDPVLVAEHPDLGRSPAMAAAGRGSPRRGPGPASTTSRTSTSTRASRARCTSPRTRSASQPTDPRGLTVTGGPRVPRRSGERIPHALDRGDGRAAARRSDGDAFGLVSGVGMHMTKHVFGVYSPRPAAGQRHRRRSRPGARCRSWPRTTGPRPWPATRSSTTATGRPTRALLVCDVPGGARTYATVTDLDVCTHAEHEELVGANVVLATERGGRTPRSGHGEPGRGTGRGRD